MPTTPLGIWTPADSDDWDLTVDLAAMGTSIDTAIGTVSGNIKYQAGLTSARPAAGSVTEGFLYYATDTNTLWRRNETTWVLFGFGPFKSIQVQNTGTGTVTSVGSMGPLTDISLSTSVTTGVACRAKVSLSFQAFGNAVGTAFTAGVAATGATTITPVNASAGAVRFTSETASSTINSYSNSWFIDLNAGTTTLSVVGQAEGSGGTRSIRYIGLIVEPVSE